MEFFRPAERLDMEGAQRVLKGFKMISPCGKGESHLAGSPVATKGGEWLAKTDDTGILGRASGNFWIRCLAIPLPLLYSPWLKINASLRWSFSMRVSSDGRVLPSSEMFNLP